MFSSVLYIRGRNIFHAFLFFYDPDFLCLHWQPRTGNSVLIFVKTAKMTRPKYFTPNEVAIHNTVDDLWVSFLGKVYNLTPLCEKYQGLWVEQLSFLCRHSRHKQSLWDVLLMNTTYVPWQSIELEDRQSHIWGSFQFNGPHWLWLLLFERLCNKSFKNRLALAGVWRRKVLSGGGVVAP